MTDLETWLCDYREDYIFKYIKYKKVWTPYEMDKKFMDESEYENGGYYHEVRILRAIELPDKDVLLEMELVTPDDVGDVETTGRILYEKLSEIKLVRDTKDGEEY